MTFFILNRHLFSGFVQSWMTDAETGCGFSSLAWFLIGAYIAPDSHVTDDLRCDWLVS